MIARRGNEIGRINLETFEWEPSHRFDAATGQWRRIEQEGRTGGFVAAPAEAGETPEEQEEEDAKC